MTTILPGHHIEDTAGAQGLVVHHTELDSGTAALVLQDPHGATLVVAPSVLGDHPEPGLHSLPCTWESLRAQVGQHESEPSITIPLMEERVRIERRVVDGDRVRVERRTQTLDQQITEELISERVEVERVPIGTLIDEHPSIRQEGDVLIIPCVEEVLVVERRLRLREEVRVKRVLDSDTHQETVTLNQHTLSVSRLPADPEHSDGT